VAFFAEVAGAHAGRRLVLGSTWKALGAVTLIEPISGNNLTHKLTRHHRAALVAACRSALKKLGGLGRLVSAGRRREAHTAARQLFVGRWT